MIIKEVALPDQYLKFVKLREKAKGFKLLRNFVLWWRKTRLIRGYGRWQLRRFRKLLYSIWVGWEQDKSYQEVRMGYSTLLICPENIKLENDIFVWHHSILDGTGGLEIGSRTQIGSWVGIFTHSAHISIRLETGRYFKNLDPKGFIVKPVKIGRNVFIASGTKIGPGVTIGNNVVIAMNSVVINNIPANSIVAGNPARVIGSTKDVDRRFLAAERKKNGRKSI